MKVNPCRYCALSAEYNGRHYPYGGEKCAKCENLVEHRKHLLSKRQFSEGDTITSLEELLQQEWVMWNHSTRHIKVIRNMQLNTVLMFLERGAFRKAVRKEVGEKSNETDH